MTPLPLARHAVVVAVHLHAGAVAQEIARLLARGHLRAMSASVALEVLSGCRCRGYSRRCSCGRCNGSGCSDCTRCPRYGDARRRRRRRRRRGSEARCNQQIRTGANADHQKHREHAAERAAGMRIRWGTTRWRGRSAPGAHHPYRARPSFRVLFQIERNQLAKPRAYAVALERRDVHEYLDIAARRAHEAETALIVPASRRPRR